MENPSNSVVRLFDYAKWEEFEEEVRKLSFTILGADDCSAETYVAVKHAIALGLGLIDPTKPYGTELFLALARVGINVAVEMGCVRYLGGRGWGAA